MRFNQTEQQYLNVLRENEIFPPFSDVEELVMSHEKRKRGFALFAWPLMEAGLIALIAIAAFWQFAPSAKQFIAIAPVKSIGNGAVYASALPPTKGARTVPLQFSDRGIYQKRLVDNGIPSSGAVSAPVSTNSGAGTAYAQASQKGVDNAPQQSNDVAASLHKAIPISSLGTQWTGGQNRGLLL